MTDFFVLDCQDKLCEKDFVYSIHQLTTFLSSRAPIKKCPRLELSPGISILFASVPKSHIYLTQRLSQETKQSYYNHTITLFIYKCLVLLIMSHESKQSQSPRIEKNVLSYICIRFASVSTSHFYLVQRLPQESYQSNYNHYVTLFIYKCSVQLIMSHEIKQSQSPMELKKVFFIHLYSICQCLNVPFLPCIEVTTGIMLIIL